MNVALDRLEDKRPLVGENGVEKPRAEGILAAGVPEKVCSHVHLGHKAHGWVAYEDCAGREEAGILYVPKAGAVKVEEIRDILAKIHKVKVAVCGDFCLDAYWHLDSNGSEVSVETGHTAAAVGEATYSLGGAGNVVANIAALEPESISAIGVVGTDPFGRELLRQLEELHVGTGGIVVQDSCFSTMTYCKQLYGTEEVARLDFGVFSRRTEATDRSMLSSLRAAFRSADVVVLNQQVAGSITNESFIEGVNALIAEFPKQVVVLDSRHYAGKFKTLHRKMNQHELAAFSGVDLGPGEMLSLADIRKFASKILRQSGRPVFVTRGARGIFACDSAGEHGAPGIQVSGRLDPVGAGDTVLSAVACCLGAGIGTAATADFAGLAAGVTVQKILQTGTAGGAEILAMAREADYVYQPELAEEPILARYCRDSEIEICCDQSMLPRGRILHAVFDNDGTLSVLRHGWENVMERVMIRLILGDRHRSIAETLRAKAAAMVREYIGRSAGIQTIAQMEELVSMIKAFGLVPVDKIRDKAAYRDIYYRALMEQARARMEKLRNGELAPEDFMIKGALRFLEELRKKGVTLYLTSGADSRDVVSEAKAMGYSELFNGGIYGTSDELSMHPKRIMIDNIIRDNRLGGEELACFGDGPVEMRECRRCGGVAVGLATDEVVRYGLNLEKRTRLIKAGAQIVVPDFSQGEALVELLFCK
ncbi:MAG: PfkB family carbohydrate kinase [bacterium]